MRKKIKKIFSGVLGMVMCTLAVSANVDAATGETVYLCGVKKCYREGKLDTVDATQYFNNIKSYYLSSDSHAQVYTSNYFTSMADFVGMLRKSNYLYVSTHGNNGILATYDTNGNNNGSISAEDFDIYNSKAFSNVKVCVLLACSSACGTTNVSKALYEKGVKCVVGFKRPIGAADSVEWQRYFADAHAVGWSVARAIRHADRMVYQEIDSSDPNAAINWGFMNSHVVYGDSSLVFEEDE